MYQKLYPDDNDALYKHFFYKSTHMYMDKYLMFLLTSVSNIYFTMYYNLVLWNGNASTTSFIFIFCRL